MLTPNDISSKKFEKAAFGYKPEEVDAFLSEIIESYKKMYESKVSAEEKLEVLAEKLEEYRANEDSLKTVLLGAQKKMQKRRMNILKKRQKQEISVPSFIWQKI